MSPIITHTQALELLCYDPLTGVLTWRIDRNQMKAGMIVGTPQNKGYRAACVAGRMYLAHRLAWFITHGEWPSQIDHINGDRMDNRLANLRIASYSQNNANMRRRKDNSSGYKGVSFHKQKGRWRAYITKDGHQKSLGLFDSVQDARIAYAQAAEKLFGEFARAA